MQGYRCAQDGSHSVLHLPIITTGWRIITVVCFLTPGLSCMLPSQFSVMVFFRCLLSSASCTLSSVKLYFQGSQTSWVPFCPPINDLEHASYRLLSVGVFFLTLSMIVGGMHWAKQPEFVTSSKLVITIALWLGYILLFLLRMGNKLFGSRFAKSCIALFFIAILSLSVVNSKTTDSKEENTSPNLTPTQSE